MTVLIARTWKIQLRGRHLLQLRSISSVNNFGKIYLKSILSRAYNLYKPKFSESDY